MQLAQNSAEIRSLASVSITPATGRRAPFVYASPHSGRRYSPAFLKLSRLDPLALRRSEDFHVDELFAAAPRHGAPLVQALFPRAFCDVNREPFELDPSMFDDSLPPYANTTSPRVLGGLGTIARLVGAGHEIYAGKLPLGEALQRIERCYRPYHRALREEVEATHAAFGLVVLVDCHSMPSIGGQGDHDQGVVRPDIVLGDRFGASCAPAVIDAAESCLGALGYRVARNAPYAGGYTTAHYGRPETGRHALQIEINRALYMDERKLEKLPRFAQVAADMEAFVRAFAAVAGALPLAAA
ncbi:MAG: N-formylglutamate amidohydrolase [Alphaproteobacteria bacterium]|nr:N-formylglutamate amidohydrolase [Alphaproteobacteria bacterium]